MHAYTFIYTYIYVRIEYTCQKWNFFDRIIKTLKICKQERHVRYSFRRIPTLVSSFIFLCPCLSISKSPFAPIFLCPNLFMAQSLQLPTLQSHQLPILPIPPTPNTIYSQTYLLPITIPNPREKNCFISCTNFHVRLLYFWNSYIS